MEHLLAANWSANASDEGDWWQEWGDTQPYLKEKDNLPTGSVLPSILLKKPLSGDRGHVTAKGRWSNGVWQLEMSRLLDTGSKYDLAITDGIYLWVAVFDHSQTRHSYHIRPVYLNLED